MLEIADGLAPREPVIASGTDQLQVALYTGSFAHTRRFRVEAVLAPLVAIVPQRHFAWLRLVVPSFSLQITAVPQRTAAGMQDVGLCLLHEPPPPRAHAL